MLRHAARSATQPAFRAFSTTSSRAVDMARLQLIGRLGNKPEVRFTKNNKEFVTYTVATHNPVIPAGESKPTTTWHHILCFNPNVTNYLRTLKRGALVYVEADFELRQPDPNADAESPEGQRQIFLRHQTIRVLRQPFNREEENQENQDGEAHEHE